MAYMIEGFAYVAGHSTDFFTLIKYLTKGIIKICYSWLTVEPPSINQTEKRYIIINKVTV